jgi:hypothetical protein
MGDSVRLRSVEEAELANLVRLLWDPAASGEFQFFGFRVADDGTGLAVLPGNS